MGEDAAGLFPATLDYLRGIGGTEAFVEALGARVPPPFRAPPERPKAFMRTSPWRDLASPASRPLVEAIVAGMDRLPWQTPYGPDDGAGAGFHDRAMATEHLGGAQTFGDGEVATGVFTVGPAVTYHDHAHAPVELYLPIAGRATFWSESRGWRDAGPDEIIVHQSWEWHAMRTGAVPVLILWAWIGPDGIGIRPILRCEMAGLPVGAAGG